ncbi:MAG: exodeoxyribonuclease V subunit gamma [Lachnospiraceae bacterium]|nr:exodeoxyribonuclease V subunit gamma [Lachnospiraceae bacterium]
MSLQFIIGSSGSGKSYTAYQEIIRLAKEESGAGQYKGEETSLPAVRGRTRKNYLILVPEQFTLQTQKALVSMHPDHGIMNIDVLSFLRLAYRVFDELGGDDRMVLEDTGKSIIVKKVLLNEKNHLNVYASNIRRSGFVDEMKSLISEFYQYGISPADLSDAKERVKGRSALMNKLDDVKKVYEGFREFLRERYITAEEILDVLGDMLDESAFVRDAVVCLDGFTGFTPSQYKLLSALLRNASRVYMTVTMDPRALGKTQKEHQLFYLSYRTMEKLKELAKDEQVLTDEPIILGAKGIPVRFRHSVPLAMLERNLFRYPSEEYRKEQEDIQIRSLENQEAEVSYAASEILRLVREEGLRYRDIAIVCGDIATYGRMIRKEFERAGIPCFVDDKKTILMNPFVEFLRAGIEIAAKDFSYESVFRYLRCGMTDWSGEEVDLLEEYVLALGIRGHRMWQREWTRTYRTRRPVLLDTLNALRVRLAEELSGLYEVLSDPERTVLDYTTALYEFVLAHGIEEKLRAMAGEYQKKGDLLAAKEYEQIYRIVMELFDRVAGLLGEDVLPLKEYGEIMETGFAEGEVGLIPPGVDQVVAGDTQRTRLTDIQVLFFLGVNDGLVPKKEDGGGILSDMERELLIGQGMELAPTKRQNAYTGQFYLYLCLTKPQKKLYVTYARLTEEGKSLRASYLIGKLCAMFPKLTIRQDEERTAAALLGSDRGRSALKKGLRDYAKECTDKAGAGIVQDDPSFFFELYGYFYRSGQEGKEALYRLVDGAFYTGREEGISRHAAALLYGRMLAGSVTRLEQYAACAFSHFLTYGLGLEERAEYKLGMPDIGTIFHNALERFSVRLKDSEYNWHTLPDALRDQWGSESVRRAAEEYGGGILGDTRRNEYMITRVDRILKRALCVLTEQLKSGEFEPEAYEMAFTCADRYLRLTGRIDRLDVYEEEDKLYLKVIDYKSGSTVFDMAMLYYGLQLQLGVYLNAVTRLIEEGEDGDAPKERLAKRIVPAGVFYYHLDDPIVDKSDHVEEDIRKALKMDGIANRDTHVLGLLDRRFVTQEGGLAASVKSDVIPVETDKSGELGRRSSVTDTEGFQAIMGYVNDKMAEFSERIMDGYTAVNPYRMGSRTACDYCPYTSVCGFDCRMPWDEYRNLKKLSKDDVWIRIRAEQEKKDQNRVDGSGEAGEGTWQR